MKVTTLGLAAALALVPSTLTPPPRPPLGRPADRDSAITVARAALAAGRPWMATRVLAPILRDSALRSPEVEFLAASAAAGWRGWRETSELLEHASWLDTEFDGGGHELLARATLGLERDSAAREHAASAVRLARDAQSRGERLVLLALAVERMGSWDSAAAAYQAARAHLPSISDWLGLRAASVTRDSVIRAAVFTTITDSLVRGRLPVAEASALVRAGDTATAIGRYERAGQTLSALRLRVARADSAGRVALRNTLLAFIADRSGSSQARLAVRLLDSLKFSLTAPQEVMVARSVARSGPLSRAAHGYAAAFDIRPGTSEERLAWGDVLLRLGRYRDAIAQYRKVTAPPPIAAAAGYHRARALVRDGRVGEGRAQLARVIKAWPRDTSAALALYLLADLAADDRRDRVARRYYGQIVRQHRQTRLAAPAAFRAALIAYADSMYEVAGTELDSLEERHYLSSEALPALYWAGRAWHDAGDTARARARWREVMARDSASYYAEVSARRLGVAPWAPARVANTFTPVPDLEVIAARADLLSHVMLEDEALAERARLARDAGGSAERLLAAADVMHRHSAPSEAIALARRAHTAGVPRDSRVYRLMYPLGFEPALIGEASRAGVDPALVAALIRQESLFNPAATSVAGARGLMQVMPDLGRKVARSLGYESWDPVLLYQGDANLEIGTTHLRDLLATQGNVVEVLAAYNAGGHRVVRWRTRLGAEDPELLAERIPFVETRDYVRIVQRNRTLYRALYDWPDDLSLRK
jgi:soluble lytic murein transglycosylase